MAMTDSVASTPSAASPGLARIVSIGEWVLTLGLAAALIWTTLCLGGYLADTMVYSAPGIWALAALASVLLALQPRAIDWRVWLPVPFLLFALGSVLWIAPAKWLAWREWFLWFQMWIVFAVFLHFGRSRAQTWTLVGTLVGLGLVGVAMAAYQRFVDPKWIMLGRTQAEQFWTRSAGMFGIPNSLAALLELTLPVFLVCLGSRKVSTAWKIACGWLAVLFVFALVLTGSRGGWIGAGVALLMWPVLGSRSRRHGALGAAGVVAALGVGLVGLYIGSPAAKARIDPFLEGTFESSRPIIWKAGVKIWQTAPWVGTGAASYNVVFDQFRARGFLNEPDWTHNDYLNTLSDYGAVGFALWFGAGAWLLAFGWQGVREARRSGGEVRHWFETWRGKLGLWLGLLAYAVHLGVDFHTKIPALAYAFALVLALSLRGGGRRGWTPPQAALALALVPAVAVLAACAQRGDALYRAEAVRFDWRRKLDRTARGLGTLEEVVPPALAALQQTVRIDPANGRAWGDLAHAITLSWHVTRGDTFAIGRRAEAAAERALALCPLIAEFWITHGSALDMQGRAAEAEPAFRRGLALAPHNPEGHYYLAHHLASRPGRRDEALASVETCLTLDPANTQAKALRARLLGGR